MKNVFIDSNIWLSLFHFTKDELEQFKKLEEIRNIEIKLFIPSQVHDEVKRNREVKIKDALSRFVFPDIQFPQFCKDYDEYESFSKDYRSLKKRHKEWKETIDNDISRHTLNADKTIEAFFDDDSVIHISNKIIENAERRYKAGNPPGKDNRYGDAINWECLLSEVPHGEDLFIISNDRDYQSVIDNKKLDPFLEEEWARKKGSKVYFYDGLVPFLEEHFESIKLRNETLKTQLLEELKFSSSFRSTHQIINHLQECSDWTVNQIEELCLIARNNTQVGWLIDDDDVRSFYSSLWSQTPDDELGEAAKRMKAYVERRTMRESIEK